MPRTPHAGSRSLAGAATALVTLSLGFAPGAAATSAAAGPVRAGAEHVLYSFAGPNGAGPLSGVTAGPGGVLYGTTVFGGAHGVGCVYSLTPKGSRYTERILFSFAGKDGNRPGGNVVIGAHGDLFGETIVGGPDGMGNVFELVPAGSHYTERVLLNFSGADGVQPLGTLVPGAHGDLFGVTQFGGTGGEGVIYEMTPSPTGYTEHVLHSFANTGGQPQAGLTRASNGTLFGTLYGASEVNPNGIVFSLQLRKTGPVYREVHAFQGSDGANPFAALTVDNHTGVIYGTTEYGGGTGSYGTVFSLTPFGGGYTERVLHSFARPKGGILPESPLLRLGNGDLFGTATIGGTGCSGTGCGTVFELTPAGPAYTFHVVHRFTGAPDGAEPEWAQLVRGPGGELLGTTRSGGTARDCSDGGPGGALGCGALYKLAA